MHLLYKNILQNICNFTYASFSAPYLDTRTPYLSARHGRGSCSSWSASATTHYGSIVALPPASVRASSEKRGVAAAGADTADGIPPAAAASVSYWKAAGALREKNTHNDQQKTCACRDSSRYTISSTRKEPEKNQNR